MQRIGYFRGECAACPPRPDCRIWPCAPAGHCGQDEPYDFGNATLIEDILREGQALGQARDFWHVPPAEMLFLHRKIAGMYLLGQRLRARVALRPLVAAYSSDSRLAARQLASAMTPAVARQSDSPPNW